MESPRTKLLKTFASFVGEPVKRILDDIDRKNITLTPIPMLQHGGIHFLAILQEGEIVGFTTLEGIFDSDDSLS